MFENIIICKASMDPEYLYLIGKDISVWLLLPSVCFDWVGDIASLYVTVLHGFICLLYVRELSVLLPLFFSTCWIKHKNPHL